MRRVCFVLPILLTVALPCFAVTLTIGNEVASPNAGDGTTANPVRTNVDLVHPATHTGNLTSARVYWSNAGCGAVIKIKVFRRVGDTLTLVGERGPFAPTANSFTVALTPSIAVKQGDLIGVTRTANCGNAGTITGFPSEGYLQYEGDITGTVGIAAAVARQGGTLALAATGTVTEWTARIIPNVGSIPGAFGSNWKTEMQFFNPQSTGSMTAKLVFHPSGTPGSTADPTRLVMLDPGEVFSTADVVAAMGQTGQGSLDISVPAGQQVPMILARVYNDGGSAGTSSFTEEAIEVSDALELNTNILARGVTGYLLAPRDPGKTRFNVGVRTLYSGATLQITVRNPDGTTVRTITRTYTANFFVQTDAAAFAGGPVGADQSIQVTVTSGSAIVYGTSTDNTTNDPAFQCAYGVFGIA